MRQTDRQTELRLPSQVKMVSSSSQGPEQCSMGRICRTDKFYSLDWKREGVIDGDMVMTKVNKLIYEMG